MTTGFGEYTLDEARRELLRGGAAVHLTPKAYELLRLLLERRPAAVSKAEIHDRIWPGTFVSDVNLATLVFEIRTAIGDDTQAPRYIRTVRGFGYAFCEDVAAQPGAAASPRAVHGRLIWGAREIALYEGENVLGRTPEAVAWVDHGLGLAAPRARHRPRRAGAARGPGQPTRHVRGRRPHPRADAVA